MASFAINSATASNALQSAGTAKAAGAQTETTTKAPATLQPDTVKLSAAAQAKMMHRAGQSPSLIAATLGTNIASVDGYLNIKVPVQAAQAPVAAPAEKEAEAAPAPSAQPSTTTKAPEPAATTAPEAESGSVAVAAKR
jgi:hypothetical protein